MIPRTRKGQNGSTAQQNKIPDHVTYNAYEKQNKIKETGMVES